MEIPSRVEALLPHVCFFPPSSSLRFRFCRTRPDDRDRPFAHRVEQAQLFGNRQGSQFATVNLFAFGNLVPVEVHSALHWLVDRNPTLVRFAPEPWIMQSGRETQVNSA